jgi:RUN domain
LTHGRCTYRVKLDETDDENDDELGVNGDYLEDSDRPVEVTLPQYESTTLTQLLMELTSDMGAFEIRVATENALMQDKVTSQFENLIPLPYKTSETDQSTLRTLITVWLHSGEIHKTLMLLVQAHATILTPYYHKNAFLRSKENANQFARQLRSLEGVEIFVDTMTMQATPRLEDLKDADISTLVHRSVRSASVSSSVPPASPQTEKQDLATGMPLPSILTAQFTTSSSTPRYLDFNRNETFAASLRSERERRIQSWERIVFESMEEGVPIIHRKRGASDEDRALHTELHHIAKIFFAGTNMLALRDAGRRPTIEVAEAGEGAQSVQSSIGTDSGDPFALLLVETVCPKRRIEVPDDDSSFLLRAQVGIRSLSCCVMSFWPHI